MAAETGIPSVYLEHQLSHGRITKKSKGCLIERLRHKTTHSRSWNDSIKSVRNSIAERRVQTESTEASEIQKCLDTLQKAMKVISQQTLKERLDLIGRQLGLSTQIQDQKVSLGMDAFHVDIFLGDKGLVSSVHLANQGDTVDCPDLKDILIRGQFTEFIEHLQGLQSIYQVTNDEKLKSKAVLALQALEKDLNQLHQFQSSISGVANYIHKCPLGIMLPRLAGKPMKLIYFVSPYDLLDKKSLTAHPLTVEAITENFLGQNVTVCIEPVPESAPLNKMQTMPLMNVSKTQDGKSLPSFSGVSQMNSMMLPANFVLVLPQSIPVSTQILQKVTNLTNLEIHQEQKSQSLRSLILQTFSKGCSNDSNKLFVSLPSQHHIYFLNGLNGSSQDQQGRMISRIPFTHPTHVPQILNLMRQQLLFNIVVASCIRSGSSTDTDSSIVFEVTAVSLQQLTIVFEHPAYDSMITVDIDLSDITNLKCRVSCSNPDQVLCSDEAVSRIFQRCMSIPVMLRWLISKGFGQLDKLKEASLAAERERMEKLLLIKEMQQRQAKSHPANLPAKGRPPPQPPYPPPLPPPPSYPHQSHGGGPGSHGQPAGVLPPILAEARGIVAGLEEFRNMTENNNAQRSMNDAVMTSSNIAHNSLLSNTEDEKLGLTGSHPEIHDSPMLSRLLDDNTSVATTVIPMNCKPTPAPPLKRTRKRRSRSDISGPSVKHRLTESDPTDHCSVGSSMDMEMGHNVVDQGLSARMVTSSNVAGPVMPSHGPTSHHHHHHHPHHHHQSVLNHSASAAHSQRNVIDLTEDNLVGEESSLKKLADSVDKHFIHKDVKTEPDLSMLLHESEAPSRIPNILQNSPSGSKNENASTSLEGFLKGSGEVGRAQEYDPSESTTVHTGSSHSKLSSLLLACSDSPPPVFSTTHKLNSFTTVHKAAAASNSVLQDVKPSSATLRKGQLRHSSSLELLNDKQSVTGIFDKFDLAKQQHIVKSEVMDDDKLLPAGGKVSIKLRVGPLKQQNNMKPSVKSSNSFDEAEMAFSKSNNIGTFDFKSDEDDDDNSIRNFYDRYVYSSSPNRHQMPSNKQKRTSDSALVLKPDKAKKKDKSSGNATKRKRDKEESKREKKRKKNEHIVQESVYRTVENDEKADFKLKIRVAKKPVSGKSDAFSDAKGQSYEISKKVSSSPVEEKFLVKHEVKEPVSAVTEVMKEKDVAVLSSNVNKAVIPPGTRPAASYHKASKSLSSKLVQGAAVSSKTDPKLVTKATIRLKPLTMPNSGSTVNISQSGPKSAGVLNASTAKQERRSSTSTTPTGDKRSAALNSLLERRGSSSAIGERRSTSQSLSSSVSSPTTTPVTTMTANLSLSSILPNAPTVSKIASLPRIPKLSSSSSNTSISRTSSLDPASGSSPALAGTKANNSYTVGPAGRPNLGTIPGPGPGGGRPPGNNSGPSFNYNANNRPVTQGTMPGNSSNNRSATPGFTARGLSHRQTSPLLNSGQNMPSRPTGPLGINRTLNTSSGNGSVSGNSQKSGPSPANSHKPSTGNVTFNSVVKGNIGSSNYNNPSVPMKPFGSGAKTNSSINSSPKIGGVAGNISSKSSGTNNPVNAQRQFGSNAHQNNINSRSAHNSPSVSRSPNTSTSTKSPSCGKSPLSATGRSPSIGGSAGKSPNMTSGASKSPTINNISKSPNINSSGMSRSPSMSISHSPNTSTVSSRQATNSNTSGKSAFNSVKQSSSGTKSPSVNKTGTVSIPKSHQPQSSAPKVISSHNSGSLKLSPSKTVSKITDIPSSISTLSCQQTSGSKPITSPINNKLTSSTSVSWTTAVASPSTLACSVQKPTCQILPATPSGHSQAVHTLTPVSSHTPTTTTCTTINCQSPSMVINTMRSSSPSPNVSPAQLSPVRLSDTPGNCVTNKGSKSNSLVPQEKLIGSTSSTPTTPISAGVDNKNKFNFPVSRGRKNSSLSAIVDKLKNNVVGSSADTTVSSPIGNPGSAGRKNLTNANTLVKFSKGEVSGTGDSGTFLENRSPNSDGCWKPQVLDDSADKMFNSLSDKEECSKNTVMTKDERQASTRPEQIVKEIKSSISFDSHESDHGMDMEKAGMVLKNISCLDNIHSVNMKPSCVNASASWSSEPLSPQASPLALQMSVPTSKGGTQVLHAATNQEGTVFKIPPVKSSVDTEDDVTVTHVVGKSVETLDDGSSEKERKLVEKCSSNVERKSSSKLLSSPLSDISSPENGLVIDDDEVPRSAVRTTGTAVICSARLTPPKMIKNDSINTSLTSEERRTDSPQSASNTSAMSKNAKSPALGKNPSGASTPKGSDSPCEIDDDLMDVALGFGS